MAAIFPLLDEAATERLAAVLAPLLGPGDTLLLEGAIGAGKTHFARALIRARLKRAEEVPSPTFTLVQSYPGDVEIWHADLYRLSHPDEVAELGLDEAFGSAICLVEWPDRLGSHRPAGAIRLRLAAEGAGRRAEIDFGARQDLARAVRAGWTRAEAATHFVAASGWGDATRQPLAGDASARRYERLAGRGGSVLLMDAPPGQADDVGAFVRVAEHLRGLGLSAPRILAGDLAQGFLLIEDFGDGLFARLIAEDPAREAGLYESATDVLLRLQPAAPLAGLPDLTAPGWAEAAAVAVEWYGFAITGARGDRGEFVRVLADVLGRWADGPRVMILRDYHAENLMLLPERSGIARVGLLDFQLAQLGQPGYDLVSLLQDARRDVAPAVEAAMIRRFLDGAGVAAADFGPAYAALGAQRALRILGVFARLCLQAGRPGYIGLMPRVWLRLRRNLDHPALAPLARICDDLIPEPGSEARKRIEAQCGNFR